MDNAGDRDIALRGRGVHSIRASLILFNMHLARLNVSSCPAIDARYDEHIVFRGGRLLTPRISVYVTEAFMPYSASAVAAATLLRSIAGAAFPLFGEQVFERLG